MAESCLRAFACSSHLQAAAVRGEMIRPSLRGKGRQEAGGTRRHSEEGEEGLLHHFSTYTYAHTQHTASKKVTLVAR